MTSVKELTLEITQTPHVLDVEGVFTPDALAGKSIEDIKNMELQIGRRKKPVSEFFEVSGEVGETPEETKLIIKGNVSMVKRIGLGMTAGEIVVDGDAGMYVGAMMKGGKITVNGNVDSFAGREMLGGELTIKGNAGDYLGSSYRGNIIGMKGGTITVEGDAGVEVGEYLSGGTIIVKGNVDIMCGIHMQKGIIIVEGNSDGRLGESAEGRGTIFVKGKIHIGPVSYLYTETVENPEVKNYGEVAGKYHKFVGDTACRGNKKVKIYASVENNNHLLPGNPIPYGPTDAYDVLHKQ